MISKLDEHLREGKIVLKNCDFTVVLAQAERISRLRTPTGGHRSFDLLHVATAVELGVREFWSFDGNQNSLARTEGMATPLD